MNKAAWSRLVVGGLVLLGGGLAAVAECSAGVSGGAAQAATAVATPPTRGEAGAVTVSGNELMRDGRPWVPHGVNLIAFVTAPGAQAVEGVVFKTAYEGYKPGEFWAMKRWGADTVRMQVSVPGTDCANQLFSQEFVRRVEDAVWAARAAGLNVIVSLQDETQSGQDPQIPGEQAESKLPDAATERVWAVLGKEFRGDRGVMYEMFNEPQGPTTLWPEWKRRMEAVVAVIRATGAKNVVVADGLQFATNLQGAPELEDSEHQVAYAIHPYFHKLEPEGPEAWETKFGNLAKRHPVIATEWTTVFHPQPNKPHGYVCDADTPALAVALLGYLEEHRIGMTAWTWDFAGLKFGSVLYGFPESKVSTFTGKACGDAGFGPGEVLEEWFRTGVVPRS